MASQLFNLDDYCRPVLKAPGLTDKILLHSCCALCAGDIMLAIQASGIEQTVYFYNPNIHPAGKYGSDQ